jgi:3-hydroxyacyl-CoA dehydrogenase
METNAIKKITVVAQAGYEVTLCGRSEQRLHPALQKIERNLRELAQWDIMPEGDIKPALDRIRLL